MAGSLAVPALLYSYVALTSREQAITQSRASLQRIAQVAQEHAQRVVETNDVISRSVRTQVRDASGTQLRPRADELHILLRGLGSNLPQLQSIWIWDEDGRPIASSVRPDPPSNLSVADRAYFQWARATRDTGWYVSEPLISRTTGQPFFDFSLRRETASGDFAGAISVSLSPTYFSRFFSELVKEDPSYSVNLLRADGVIISRYPSPPAGVSRLASSSPLLQAMQAQSSRGETQGTSTIDGRTRYVAYHRVSGLPLYVAATADQVDVLAPWRRSMAVLAAFTFPLAAGLFALCWFALSRVRQAQRAAAAHAAEYEQRHKAEEALRQAQKLEALGRMTGGVAHDFNNVLMVVQSSVALARMLEQRGQPIKPAIEPIERAVANGAQLTRQLLAVARRQPLRPVVLDVGAVVEQLGALLRSLLTSRIKLHLVLPPSEELVELDQGEFELALINLCINAKDAISETGEIFIEVGEIQPPGARTCVQILVRDSGIGMPADVLSKATDPFFTTKPLGKGTGLGLSQVQGFVDRSGGNLQIESQLGKGTTVSLVLPKSIRASSAAPIPAADEQSVRDALRGKHVLLVEDNADIAKSLAMLLEDGGAIIHAYASAEAALTGCRAGVVRPDIVLSDISLSGEMTGVDLVSQLLLLSPGLPVVLMTGYAEQLDVAVSLGLTVLAKPVGPRELTLAVRKAVAQRQTDSPVVS